jgi:hypothetical protein
VIGAVSRMLETGRPASIMGGRRSPLRLNGLMVCSRLRSVVLVINHGLGTSLVRYVSVIGR